MMCDIVQLKPHSWCRQESRQEQHSAFLGSAGIYKCTYHQGKRPFVFMVCAKCETLCTAVNIQYILTKRPMHRVFCASQTATRPYEYVAVSVLACQLRLTTMLLSIRLSRQSGSWHMLSQTPSCQARHVGIVSLDCCMRMAVLTVI